MKPFRRILVPVDGLGESRRPIEHAEQLARHFDAEVILVHVDDALPGRPIDEAERRSAARASLDGLSAALEQVRIPCRTTQLRVHPPKEPAEAIVAAAREEHADLIVMGTHARTGLSRLFRGSVAEEVVRHAPCATLVVRLDDVVPGAAR